MSNNVRVINAELLDNFKRQGYESRSLEVMSPGPQPGKR